VEAITNSTNERRLAALHASRTLIAVLAAGLSFALLNALLGMTRSSFGMEQQLGDVGLSLVRFAGVMTLTMILASQGRRILFATPYVLWAIVLPIVLYQDRIPRPLGLGWTPAPSTPPDSTAWLLLPILGVVVEAGLVLGPAVWLASTHTARPSRQPPPRTMVVCGFAVAVLAMAMLVNVGDLASPQGIGGWIGEAGIIVFFLLGVLSGSSGRIGLLVLIAPFALNADWIQLLLPGASLARLTTPAIPTMLAAGAGLLCMPVAKWFDSLSRRPSRTLLLLLLALNAADVVFTVVLMHLDGAAEANPLVRYIGLPAKFVLVSAAAILVAHLRPRWLIWPVIAMLMVTLWHMSGLMLAFLT